MIQSLLIELFIKYNVVSTSIEVPERYHFVAFLSIPCATAFRVLWMCAFGNMFDGPRMTASACR